MNKDEKAIILELENITEYKERLISAKAGEMTKEECDRLIHEMAKFVPNRPLTSTYLKENFGEEAYKGYLDKKKKLERDSRLDNSIFDKKELKIKRYVDQYYELKALMREFAEEREKRKLFNKYPFLKNLRTETKRKGIRLQDFEEYVGVSQGTIARYENPLNELEPTAKVIVGASKFFDISIDELVYGDPDALNYEEKYIDGFISKLLLETKEHGLKWLVEEDDDPSDPSYHNGTLHAINKKSYYNVHPSQEGVELYLAPLVMPSSEEYDQEDYFGLFAKKDGEFNILFDTLNKHEAIYRICDSLYRVICEEDSKKAINKEMQDVMSLYMNL